MPEKLPISCFIISKNEADRLPRTLASVEGLVDEIVVIDSGSTDETVAIAKAAGAKVVFNAWPGFGQQKRFGEDQCRHDWLLNLDADEVVPAELGLSIRAVFATGAPEFPVYGVSDEIVYPGAEKPRRYARDHYFYRLYDRRRARFKDDTLFDSVDPGGQPCGHLEGALYHHTVRSFDDLIAKCDERASYNAAHARQKSRGLLALRLVTEFPMSFVKYYFVRSHVLGGMKGFQYAMILSFYRWVRIVRMFEGAAAVEMNTEGKRPGG